MRLGCLLGLLLAGCTIDASRLRGTRGDGQAGGVDPADAGSAGTGASPDGHQPSPDASARSGDVGTSADGAAPLRDGAALLPDAGPADVSPASDVPGTPADAAGVEVSLPPPDAATPPPDLSAAPPDVAAPPPDVAPPPDASAPPPDVVSTPNECRWRARIRDFKATDPNRHPDFEGSLTSGVCPGLLQQPLIDGASADATPQLQGQTMSPCPQVSTAWPQLFDFYQWYREEPGVNFRFDVDLVLLPVAGNMREFRDDTFFPVDGRGWNDQLADATGELHNFGFTTQIVRQFIYRYGQTLLVEGDDDIWVFIDGLMVIDLGGVHAPRVASVNLDNITPPMVDGRKYYLHIFHAERHTRLSTFRIRTDICD
jgi:fibro-slime domain-containing protein